MLGPIIITTKSLVAIASSVFTVITISNLKSAGYCTLILYSSLKSLFVCGLHLPHLELQRKNY